MSAGATEPLEACESCGQPSAVIRTYRSGTAMEMALNLLTPLSQKTIKICPSCETRGRQLLRRAW